MSSQLLRDLQEALEAVYRVESKFDVRDFIISKQTRDSMMLARAPREQLLLRQGESALEIGLFVDQDALARLDRGLDDQNLDEFLLAVEGVSHLLYVMHRAGAERPFSALELELQAEVDKYLVVLLYLCGVGDTKTKIVVASATLRDRLFNRVSYHPDLSSEERDRYSTANAAAHGYASSLESRFVRNRAFDDLYGEVRRFYRLGCAEKLDHIARKAA